jgi:hypothetical protein
LKGKYHGLIYLGEEKWALKEDEETLKVYNSSDLRMTLVYRSRCFDSEEASLKYKRDNIDSQKGQMTLEDILTTLINDMIDKSVLPSGTTLDSLSRIQVAKSLLKTYNTLPLPSTSKAFFPYNYCMISKLEMIKNDHIKYLFKGIESYFCKSNTINMTK